MTLGSGETGVVLFWEQNLGPQALTGVNFADPANQIKRAKNGRRHA